MKYFIGIIVITILSLSSCKEDKPSVDNSSPDLVTTNSQIKETKAVQSKAVAEVAPANSANTKVDKVKESVEKRTNQETADVKKASSSVVEKVKEKSSDVVKTKEEAASKSKSTTDRLDAPIIEDGGAGGKKGTKGILKETTIDMSTYRKDPNLKVTVPKTNPNANKGKSVPKPETKIKEEVEQVGVPGKSKGPNKPGEMNLSHSSFHKLLSDHVTSSGVVNYGAIKADGRLDTYLKILESANVNSLSNSEQLAFWINAYNAYTIKKITSNYPLKSITDLNGGKPWDEKWINLNGKTLSLNDIENSIIRPQFNEPRIHFAVNCAAKSCPPILNKAYSAGNLNTHMENLTKQFINNSKYNQISKDKVIISKIFEWYKEDFGNIINYLNKYSSTQISDNATVEYMEYDWSLNDK